MSPRFKLYYRCTFLVLLLALAAASLFLGLQETATYETVPADIEEEYDYHTIQGLVDLPPSSPEEPGPAEEHNESAYANQIAIPTMPTYEAEEMLAINQDFKGWLWIPGTDVNYPVVQTKDNETYLNTSFQGSRSSFGTLFLDKDCSPSAQNHVIHGHNMGNGRTEMFSSLLNYQDITWAEERAYAYFIEPEHPEDSEYQLFAVLNFSVYHLDEFNYFQSDFDTEEEFQSFIFTLKSLSLYTTDFTPQQDILILSTCNSHYGKDNRLLVCYGRDPTPE